jgi:putative membrane protein
MPGGMADLAEPVAAACFLTAVAGYLVAAGRLRRRGNGWPPLRDVSFTAGGTGLAAAMVAPPVGGFTGHMVQHLVIGMVGPLLLVLGRPVTLVLRTIPARGRRPLLAVLHSAPAALPVWPPMAALLVAGGLWTLYRTPLFAAGEHDPWLHAAIHLHVVAAGALFAFAVCQLDPLRHRHSLPLRGAALVAVGAAHAILARSLYAAAPPGTNYSVSDVHTGAELMYYGGDAVEIALAVVLALQWYAGQGRELARARRRTAAVPRHQ